MSSPNCGKIHKYKRPKQRTTSITRPDSSTLNNVNNQDGHKTTQPLCSLLAKDSEWVDVLQSPMIETNKSSNNVSDEEEVLQLVECKEDPQMKPLAIMFPGLLKKDPQTLQEMLTRAMSTTEVTKHLVELGQKANFTLMKKATRLIPRDKQWLESLTENSNSNSSIASEYFSESITNHNNTGGEIVEHYEPKRNIPEIKQTNDYSVPNISQNTSINVDQILSDIIDDGKESSTGR
ncbi:uncharacterized protein LOC116412790 isoform X1 [Galleria mellonella]|uniref:Uncharacterized protein LOC116412790 isoform X1 n=1 Tax=Galleria mellonella TaxID=7137 RepID=A0A6J3BYU2_GALME|nr:uncharacterized protein LOC116412790 isoform X1 [Galleria mellonella]